MAPPDKMSRAISPAESSLIRGENQLAKNLNSALNKAMSRSRLSQQSAQGLDPKDNISIAIDLQACDMPLGDDISKL